VWVWGWKFFPFEPNYDLELDRSESEASTIILEFFKLYENIGYMLFETEL
jgi:hypothetical protein